MYGYTVVSDHVNRCVKRGIAVLLIAVLVVLLPTPARAHTITVDGNMSDWCLGAAAFDTRSVQNCGAGNEIMWTDGGGDTVSGVGNLDIYYFSTTADASNLYFLVLIGAYGGAEHVQIAIDVDGTTSGVASWYDPIGMVGTGAGASAGLSPDYIIVTSLAGGTATLYESVTTGAWVSLGPVALGGASSPLFEIAVPWAAFGVLPFGPGTPVGGVDITVMSTSEFAPGMPFASPDDVISEPSAGTWTSTPTSCPTGPGATTCEIADGSADAFIHVTYTAPNAVRVAGASASGARGWVIATPVAVLIGSVLLGALRRRRLH